MRLSCRPSLSRTEEGRRFDDLPVLCRGNCARPGSEPGVLWLAKPSTGDQQPNFVARNRGFFEALPGFLFGGGLGCGRFMRGRPK